MSAYDKVLENFEDKLDSLLSLQVIKNIEPAKSKCIAMEGLYNKRIDTPVIIEIDWNFAENPTFKNAFVNSQKSILNALLNHLNSLVTGEQGILSFYDRAGDLKPILTQSVNRLVLSYDTTNSIKDYLGMPSWKVELKEDGELYVIGNLVSFDVPWLDLNLKLAPLLEAIIMKRWDFNLK